jgi:TonB-dependent starch-binding outer membrane protein SusC
MRLNLLFTRKVLRLLPLLLIVCNTYAQSIAFTEVAFKNPLSDNQKENKLLLKNVLKDIENEFKVFINFDEKLLENRYVDRDLLKEWQNTGDVETVLSHLLNPLSLKAERIKQNIFLISLKDDQSHNKVESTIEPRSFYNESLVAALKPLNLSTTFTQAAIVPITGRVSDEKGEGLPGVSVVVKGTTIGTTTDVSGSYNLNVPDDATTLVLSFIGYITQEVAINNRTTIDVALAPDVEALAEVVVIGYQTVRRQDLTGAVSVVNPAAAARVSTNSVAESLQGLTPGVTVRSSGQPGQMSRIEIRGAASFTNTDPLYVIDGMIADANTTINNNDIESIQILKDASAAAIYGSRAANGVVIITTKQGKEGPLKVSFSAKYGVQQIPKKWDLMNATDFAAMQRTQYENSGAVPPPSVSTAFNPAINTDWQDEIMRTGNIQDYNATISGGSKAGTYLISGSYFNNKGVLIANAFERGTLRINSRSQRGRFTFGENVVLSNSNGKAIPATNVSDETNPFYNAPQMLPIIPVQGASYISATNPGGWGIGTNEAITYVSNPVAVADLSSRRYNYAKLVGNAYLEIKLTDWLSYKFNTGAEVSFDYIRDIRKLGIWEYNAAPRSSSVDEERSRFLSLLFENTLNFNKSFGAHSINGVIGISTQHTTRDATSGGKTNLQIFDNEYMTSIGSATGTSTAGGGRPVDYRIMGYLGRLNYSYNDKYLVTLTGRVDQDSRFGKNYRTGFFPSVALGWRISRENFFDISWLSDLKINASYGRLGIVPLDSWEYTSFINISPRAVFGSQQTPQIGATQARLANPNLKWEERIVQNIGVTAGFLNNSLTISLEGYNSLSKDNLLRLPVAGYLGNLQGNPSVNAGSIRNRGIEFAATFRNNKRDLKWDISANFTTINNKVEDVGNQGEGINYIQSGNTRTQVGRSLGEWYLIETAGLFQNQAEIDSYTNSEGKTIQPNAKPGDIKYIDKNDDGQINAEDRSFVGSPWPKLQTGAQFNASYKNFSLNIQLIGVFGYKIYNDVRRALDSYQQTNFRSDIDPWSSTNMGGKDPRIGLNTEQGIIDNNRGDTERWLEKGSYLRLRNLEFGYNFPNDLFGNKFSLSNTRIYVSAQNLFTITKYKGLDPDIVGNTDPNNGQVRILERGVDLGNWPASRVFSIGIQCGF